MFNVIRIWSVVNQPSCQNCLIDQLTFSRFLSLIGVTSVSIDRHLRKVLNALMSTDRRQTLKTVCWWIDNFSIDYSTTVSVQKKITWPDRHKIGRPTKKEVDICQDNSWRTADCCPNNSKKLKKGLKTAIYHLLAIKQLQQFSPILILHLCLTAIFEQYVFEQYVFNFEYVKHVLHFHLF